jgi:NADPH-dependent 2,4-dienoyl-CoA reductase/sulfur reductase-like enzyme
MAVREVEFVIVGGGVAAAKAAEGLRAAGGEGAAVVLTAEPELPYERPPLSKEFLRGEAGRDKTRTHDEGWYRHHDVEVLLATRASTLDPATRTVTTEVGDQLRYGRGVVLATGAQPNRLGLPGEDLDGVHYLRTVDDAERLRAAGGVWAAGDVANADHPLFGRIRVEHWAEALNQGLLAGRNLAGAGDRYDRVPYFFSDQFDLSLSYLGHVREWDELVVRGSREVDDPRFVAWYLRDGRPRAALIVNDWDAEDPVREVIRQGSPVEPAELQRIL